MLIKDEHTDGELHMDFVPMVDVLFNLLIFFLLATSIAQTEREMNVALPYASASGPISASVREIIINIDAQGGVIVAGKTMSDDELNATLRSAVTGNPDQKVSVRADRTTTYANVAHVLDLCKAAGIQQPYLATIPL
ncbi:Biopolymer transport protein ExbD [Phycisphaerales bacterium]|nr:Biopolymer transport protein ExbD [Phycisphaerales bacterium]